ncbi:MAG TPA: TonB-dependent receptor [Kofleriaceae bacterium]|nr:TonB-dependent receptor [Kofleriaceae bacterium]
MLVSPTTARADEPAIPIRELPPYPDVETTARVSEVSVYGASQSEEETVVGAAKREQSLGTVASAVTVLTSDHLRRYGYRSLAEALRGAAGVFIVDDRQIERIGVRGVQLLGDGNTRILILIDGTPLNEPWAQFVDGSTALPVSLDDVARIEIIRGPVSSIYGTNAFFGIINIVTLEADKSPRAYGRTSLDTFGTFGGNAGFNAGDINRQVRGTVSFKQRLGESLTYPDLPMSTDQTSADGGQALFGSLAVNLDRLFFQARAYQRARELPGAPYDSAIGSDQNQNQDRQFLAELGYTRDVTEKVTVGARIYGNQYTFTNDLLRDAGPFTTEANALWYGGEVRVLADLLEQKNLLSITTGASYESTSTESTASTKPMPIETDFSIAGAYLETSSEPLPWLAATVGARFDRNSEFTNELSPRAALFLRKGDAYGAKLLYAEGFRNPSIFEAYYDDDARFSPSLDADDRTDLSPETIRAYEAVVYGRPFTGAKLRLSAWEWRLTNLLKRNEFFDPASNETRFQFQNLGTLVSRGLEVEATYRDLVGRSAYLNGALAFTGRNCLAAGGDTFSNLLLDAEKGNCDARQNAPVLTTQVGFSSQLIADMFHVSGELTYMSERGTQDLDENVPAFVGANVVVFLPDVNGFDVTVGARNLVMREEVPAQSDYNRSTTSPRTEVLRIPGPGREVFARAGYRF